MKQLALLLCAFLMASLCTAQKGNPPSPIVFIYDASGSMWGQMHGKTKMEIAADVLSDAVNKLPENQQVGLMAYGHRKEGDCRDVEMLVAMENKAKDAVASAVKAIKPLGRTPLAHSANLVIGQIRKSSKKATVILITDGIESCDGNICNVVQAAKKEGVDFKLHIVGFGLKASETEQLKCAADFGGGRYYDAADAGALGEVLNEATLATVDDPPGNVSVYALKNGVAIDAYVKAYDSKAKRRPIAGRTYKDTVYLYLPPSTYDVEINPLEGSEVEKIVISEVESFEDKIVHRTVNFDGGKFRITTTNNGDGWDTTVKVIDKEGKVAGRGRTYGKVLEIEVNPGVYDISFQALAMKGLETSSLLENQVLDTDGVTEVSHNFKTGKVFVDAKVNGESIDSIVKFLERKTGKNVAGGRTYNRGAEFLLNPATYDLKIKPLGVHKDKKAQSLTIEVNQGENVTKEITF